MKIRDSVAFVTGANRGIGLAFVQELLAGGARKVYAAARQPERITLAGVERVRLDVTNPEDVAAANGGGAIVNLLSVLSWVAVPSAGTYSASKAAAFALTNWLRTALREQGTQVVGAYAGPIDTDMASNLTLPKVKPIEVVRQGLSPVEAGRDEVLADDMTRQVKAGLSDREGIYLNFDPERAVQTAR